MDVVTSIKKSAGSYRDVGDRMPVERKLERQLHRHCASMRLRKKLVDGEICTFRVNTLAMESVDGFILNYRRVVVLMGVFLDGCDVVLHQSLVS